jgi:hypothetical protein
MSLVPRRGFNNNPVPVEIVGTLKRQNGSRVLAKIDDDYHTPRKLVGKTVILLIPESLLAEAKGLEGKKRVDVTGGITFPCTSLPAVQVRELHETW